MHHINHARPAQNARCNKGNVFSRMATLTVGLRTPRHQKATENIRRRAAGTSIAMCNACHLSVSQSARPVGSRDTGHRSNCRCTFSEPHSAQCRLHAVIGNNLHRAPLTPPSFYPAPNAGGNRVQPPRRAARRGRAGGLLRSRDDVEVGRETPGGGEGPCGGDHRAADVVGQAARARGGGRPPTLPPLARGQR